MAETFRNLNSEPQKAWKWQFLSKKIHQNGFHVKSELQEIFKLPNCDLDSLENMEIHSQAILPKIS